MKEIKCKVIAEYDRFYLARHPKGWKECFNKQKYRPDKEGYITKIVTENRQIEL